MLRLAADESFNNNILRGLLRANPGLDIVRVQEAGLMGQNDLDVLGWAAREERVLLTHDLRSLPRHAYDRVRSGKAMPGVLAVIATAPAGPVIADILLLTECSREGEWEGQVLYLPLK